MTVTVEQMRNWCQVILGLNPNEPRRQLQDYLNAIPRLDSLGDVPRGTPVLVRGDLDAKPGAKVGQGDVRLRSMLETLQFGRERGWKQIVFGHIGRDPEGSLSKVAERLGQLLGCDVPLIADWLDAPSTSVRSEVAKRIEASSPGSVTVLENTRRYDVERVLWKAREPDVVEISGGLTTLANEFADKISAVYVNEALSAGSLDTSTTVLPIAMRRVALGKYVASEFEGPMLRCLNAQLVIFSGLKADKLDDLEAMISRGTVRMIISAGSLAMALKKATALADGNDFCLGFAEDTEHAEKPYYVAPSRIDQAKRIVAAAKTRGVELVLPVDFVLQDGRISPTIGATDQQFDVGPKTNEHFAAKVGQFIDRHRDSPTTRPVAFHNGVFGKFEDSRFEEGTRQFVRQLKRMKDAGVEVYVGGGEGGKALELYGQADWVTHCFTAGGTVLNALGSAPVPYLVALRMASMLAD